MEHGSWSGQETKCTATTCRPLANHPRYARVSPKDCEENSNKYGYICSYSCPSGFTLYGTTTRTCGPYGEWSGRNDTECRDTTRPTFSETCPKDVVAYPDKCSKTALVKWTQPTARDNSGNATLLYSSAHPPVNTSVGLYMVKYVAEDEAGNQANCSFTIQVRERRCDTFLTPRNGFLLSQTCGNLYGSEAIVDCKLGYNLYGPAKRTCLESGQWSGITATCKRVTCSSVPPLPDGSVWPVTCTIGHQVGYGTNCMFRCDEHRGFKYEGPTSAYCNLNGTWSNDPRAAKCRDVSPPRIVCPPDIAQPTDPKKSYATITWKKPVPTDLSGVTPTLTVNPLDITSPYTFRFGKHPVIYTATDESGLSTNCTFNVVITDNEPPRVIKCPEEITMVSGKKDTKIYLPSVEFEDNVGIREVTTDLTNGSSYSWGSYVNSYTASDLVGNRAVCSVKITIKSNPCPYLDPPLNGAKACETWLAGMHCTVHCNEGYKLLRRDFEKVYYCTPKGKWVNTVSGPGGKPKLPDCSKSYPPQEVVIKGELHYLTEDCSDEEVLTQIKANFIKIFSKDVFGILGGCIGNPHCKMENVAVECSSGERRKRAARLHRRSSKHGDVKISFGVNIAVPENSSQNLENRIKILEESLKKSVNDTDLDLKIGGKVVAMDRSRSLIFDFVKVRCGEGQMAADLQCVNCPVGFFYNKTVDSCDLCLADHYQTKEAQETCIACPDGTTTFGVRGARWLSECKDKKVKESDEKIPTAVVIAVPAVVVVLLAAAVCFYVKHKCKKATQNEQRSYDSAFKNLAYETCGDFEIQLANQDQIHIYQDLQNRGPALVSENRRGHRPVEEHRDRKKQHQHSPATSQYQAQTEVVSFAKLRRNDDESGHVYDTLPHFRQKGQSTC